MEEALDVMARALAKQYHLGINRAVCALARVSLRLGEDDDDVAIALIEQRLQRPEAIEPWGADADDLLENLNRAGFAIIQATPKP